jgi:hypothetical protein
MKRLTVVADLVVSMTQTSFIPRRNILEGWLFCMKLCMS